MGKRHSKPAQWTTPWSVTQNNWLEATRAAVNAESINSKANFSIWPSPDPAVGCSKQYAASYTCSPGSNTKTVIVKAEAAGNIALFDCSREYAACTGGILTIGDDGNLTLTNGGETIWQSGTSQVGLSLEKYRADNSKYKRNYLKTGEFLWPGEFIGSPSGNCALFCIGNEGGGGECSLSIVYYVWGCNKQGKQPSNNAGGYGFITNDANISATYSMKDGPIDNVNRGAVSYSNNNMVRMDYPSSMTSLGTEYIEAGSYDQPSDSIKTVSNSDLDNCKLECSAIDNCYGFIHYEKEQKCNLRSASDMFPANPNRILNKNAKMFIRQLKIANSNSCSGEIVSTTGNIFNGMMQGDNMAADTLCDLGEATAQQLNEVNIQETAVAVAMADVSKSMTTLNKQNNKLDKEMLSSLQQLKTDSKTYSKIERTTKKTTNDIVNVSAMEEDSRLTMMSQNLQYIVWSSVAAAAVIASIRVSR